MNSAANIRVPRATYRLQFNEHFRLRDAIALVPYLKDLGISHIYASPLLKAVPHSAHGYDVCDYHQLNPEIGTDAGFEELITTLRHHGMGLVLDIVPNHMGIGTRDNGWWWDVLTHGRSSQFADYFDINWESSDPRLCGKILLPVLGDYYHRVLARHEIQIAGEQECLVVRYGEHRFPLSADSMDSEIVRNLDSINKNADALDKLLMKQHYRLAYWRHGDVELNYRRFFAISTLACVRVEDEKVFRATHARIFEWIAKGWLDGLRVDHPDGLRHPQQYLERLQANAPNQWRVVEKILQPEEALPPWPVHGTTGYDFINQMDGLFVNRKGEALLSEFYRKLTGETLPYSQSVRRRKLYALKNLFMAEINGLVCLLRALRNGNWHWRDISDAELRDALEELAAAFPVYRTYAYPAPESAPTDGLSEQDKACINQALGVARENRPDIAAEIYDMLGDLLLAKIQGTEALEFVLRFQQLTVSVMAKGVEDTSFYAYNRFLALNEVGDDPGQFGLSLRQFHEAAAKRQAEMPCSMLASSTHDTKRSEDVRARICVISEIPDRWCEVVQRWMFSTRGYRTEAWPDRNLEYHFYQTLVGAWPLSIDRAMAYMEKAAQEAKQYTDWKEPNEPYHAALKHFIIGALGDPDFIREVEEFVTEIEEAAFVNSLAQMTLKLTVPGVPDFYQGTEVWDHSLVDPDNRRPVDFDLRRRLLQNAKGLSAVQAWQMRRDGTAKIWLAHRLLQLRSEEPELFGEGSSYTAIQAAGSKASHVVAFKRAEKLIVVVPRLLMVMKGDWADTTISVPDGEWQNSLTAEIWRGAIQVASLLQQYPIAILIRRDSGR